MFGRGIEADQVVEAGVPASVALLAEHEGAIGRVAVTHPSGETSNASVCRAGDVVTLRDRAGMVRIGLSTFLEDARIGADGVATFSYGDEEGRFIPTGAGGSVLPQGNFLN